MHIVVALADDCRGPNTIYTADGFLRVQARSLLAQAIRLRDKYAGEVTVFMAGAKDGEEAVEECLRLGADHALLLKTPQLFGGGEVGASSLLTAAVSKIHYDIILTWVDDVEASGVLTRSSMARELGLLEINRVRSIDDFDFFAHGTKLMLDSDYSRDKVLVKIPCLLRMCVNPGEHNTPVHQGRKENPRTVLGPIWAAPKVFV